MLAGRRSFAMIARPASRRRLLGAALAAMAATLSQRDRRTLAVGSIPTALAIPAIGVDAPVEVRTTVDGTMQDPTGAWVAAWYDDSARPGTGGNAVFAGHVDDPAGGGPALFSRLHELGRGDAIAVRGQDGVTWRYRVLWHRSYPAAGGPIWVELTGPTTGEAVTLITCAGEWDAAAETYRDRLVVRAAKVATDRPGDVPAHPRS
jgi:LPXTG-site transpeptidase (sortase) family protein